MKKTSLLFVSHSGGKAGAEKSFVQVLSAVDRRKYDVHVVIPHEGWLSETVRTMGYDVNYIRLPWLIAGDVNALKFCHRLIRTLWAALRLHCLIRKTGSRLVITNSSVVFAPALAALMSSVPHVFFVRELYGMNMHIRFVFGHRAAYHLMGLLSARLVCVSSSVREDMPKTLHRRGKSVVVLNSISDGSTRAFSMSRDEKASLRRQYGIAEDDFVVSVLSTIYPHKRQEDAVKAVRIALKQEAGIKLLVAGSGDPGYIGYLKRLSEEYGISQNIIFTGFHADIMNFYHISDAVLSCADAEPFGLTLLEALIAGRPVIAVSKGGTTDIIEDGITGLYVPPRSPEIIAEKILLLKNNPAMLAEMSTGAKKSAAEKFSPAAFSEKINNLIDSIMM